MGELHEATIEWSGEPSAASLFIAAAQAFDCVADCDTVNGKAQLSVKIQSTNLQDLRNRVDALLIEFADIEENL
tara:strand:- start:5412 stop:5633 length:222 start_codon:yes stop_codon:yes gene_type:complete